MFAIGADVQAAPLAVGGTQFPAVGEPDPTGGVVVGAPLVSPFAVPGFFIGTLTSTAIAGDPSNPLGGLTFVYDLTNAPGSPNAIARMTVEDFTGFLTDASYETVPAPVGLPPTLIDRLTADTVGFGFLGFGPGPLFPGMTSARLVVQTNAPAAILSEANIIDSGSITVPALGPVPEPASLGLLAAAGVLAIRRRSR
jgi:hypothetical protein